MADPETATAHAATALIAFAGCKSPGEYEGENWLAVRDLLSDLMHYCDARAIDFDAQLSLATDNYSAERERGVGSDMPVSWREPNPMRKTHDR